MEGLQFVLACRGCQQGKQHCRKCTLNAIRDKDGKLFCIFCGAAEAKGLAETERRFMDLLQEWELDEKFAMQVDVPWWKGRVDFMYLPEPQKSPQPCIIIQVDGTAHFTKHRGSGMMKSVERDMACCGAAFRAGARMLRIHHHDLESPDRGWVDLLLEEQSKPCVVLTLAYAAVAWFKGMKKVKYPWELASLLGDNVVVECRTMGYWLMASNA